MKTHAWIPIYSPFMMGGDLIRYGRTEVDVDAEIRISAKGKIDVVLFRVTDPNGRIFFVEKETCGVMGNDLNKLLDDYHGAHPDSIRASITSNLGRLGAADKMGSDEFWNLITSKTK